MKLFLVPVGQKTLTYYEKSIEEKHAGNFIVKTVRYVPKTMNLNNYTMEQWNMSSIEVASIEEAVKYAVK